MLQVRTLPPAESYFIQFSFSQRYNSLGPTSLTSDDRKGREAVLVIHGHLSSPLALALGTADIGLSQEGKGEAGVSEHTSSLGAMLSSLPRSLGCD